MKNKVTEFIRGILILLFLLNIMAVILMGLTYILIQKYIVWIVFTIFITIIVLIIKFKE